MNLRARILLVLITLFSTALVTLTQQQAPEKGREIVYRSVVGPCTVCGELNHKSISISSFEMPEQEKTVDAPGLTESSSLAEILDWLNKNAFPQARVGLRKRARHGPQMKWTGQPRAYDSGGERVFSEGFHIKAASGCQIELSNEQVTIIDAEDSRSFHRFITQKNGQRELTPQLAIVFLSLNRMSYKRGKSPHLLNDRKSRKSRGWWRAEYDQSGFFNKLIFDAELTAAEPPHTKELAHFDFLNFSFESRELAEQFDGAFRHAIKICTNR